MKKRIIIALLIFFTYIASISAAIKHSNLELLTKVIYIDPGHGGRDNGTSYGNILEKDLNLEISKKLEQSLLQKGAIVFMTRSSDIDLSTKYDNSKKRGDLNRRIKMIEDSTSNLYISIHINWYQNSKYGGIDVLYNDINHNNKVLAETILNSFKKEKLKVREIKKINDYMYRNINTPGILIECGFISNPDDRYLLQNDQYQQKLVSSITKGITKYLAN